MLAGVGTAGNTITASGSCEFQPMDASPVFAMSGSAAPAGGAAVSGATAAAACQSVVRAEHDQEHPLLPRRGLLQPRATARVLRATQLVPNHRGSAVHAALSLRDFFGEADLSICCRC